jgi:NADH dehydrogenase
VILLTGATGTVGSALLRRLVASGESVRCLVRDPTRLGAERVRVQLALGDLGDPGSFRNAVRGVDTVIHLAASLRDQPRGSLEELTAVATLRLVRAAERQGASRFLFFSALGAGPASRTRFFRAKALARDAVERSSLETHVFEPSIVYSADDPWMTLLNRLGLLPLVPIAGRGRARFQPIWAEDVADCVAAALQSSDGSRRYELAGPDTLSYDDIVRTALGPRPLLHLPMSAVRAGLGVLERVSGPKAVVTREEVELMEEPMVSERGTADAESLGVRPRPMREVLAAG